MKKFPLSSVNSVLVSKQWDRFYGNNTITKIPDKFRYEFNNKFLPQVRDHAFDDTTGQVLSGDHQKADEECGGIC